jgi:cation diffusion facilitator family transporter
MHRCADPPPTRLIGESQRRALWHDLVQVVTMMHPHSHADHSHDHEGHDQLDTHAHHGQGHTDGVVDPAITTSARGIWAIKWSFLVLLITALIQVSIVWISGSVALLADTIHNFGDAATAIPLWVAFACSRWKPSKRFTYGYGRMEDLAGLAVVAIIAFSAIVAGYESVRRLLEPQPIAYLGAVVGASMVGFVGNEAVAVFRIKVGKEIQSAALIADGYHARADGLASLAVLFGAIGVWLGHPLADPIVGLLITLLIVRIVWQSSNAVFTRMLDGIEPGIVEEIREAAGHVKGVEKVTQVRARWLGHRLHAELNVSVASQLSVAEGHGVAKEVQHELLHHMSYLSSVIVHVDPTEEAGEEFHRLSGHSHDVDGDRSH